MIGGLTLKYPTIEQVETASHMQLANWYRHLPSPGMCAVDRPEDFYDILEKEAAVMDFICERFKVLGGMTPEISKAIGWGT